MTLNEDTESNANDDSDVDITGNCSDVDIIDLDHFHHAGKTASVLYHVTHDASKSTVKPCHLLHATCAMILTHPHAWANCAHEHLTNAVHGCCCFPSYCGIPFPI